MAEADRTHQRQALDVLALGARNTAQLARELGLGMMATANAASELVVRGYVERSIDGEYSLTPEGREFVRAGGKLAYRVVKKGELRKKKLCRDTLRQRAWKAMRLHQRFTIPDLVTLAAKAGDRLPENNLQRYLRQLIKAGYVVRLPRNASGTSITSNGYAVYRLLKDAGEIAPVVSRDGDVVDHNTTGVAL